MDPDDRARAAAAALQAADRASAWAGAVLEAVGPGHAEMSLTVAPHHCNGHGTCHGGVIFLLADSAFAYACNSHDQRAVAHQNAITFCAPARGGDRLTARAVEVTRAGRSGVYDVTVTGPDGTLIALMRGHSRTVAGRAVPDDGNGNGNGDGDGWERAPG